MLNQSASVLIFCHIHPDGDTVGSACALYYALKKLNKNCNIVCDGLIPSSFCELFKDVTFLRPEQITAKCDTAVAVDVSTDRLLGSAWGIYNLCDLKICVDHHMSNSRYTDNCYVENLSAATIVVSKLIKELNVEFDKNIAEAVLLGIITDTGCFAHTCSSALSVASDMMQKGADYEKIVYNGYFKMPKNKSDLFLQTQSKMRFYLNNELAIITVTRAELKELGLTNEQTAGFVDYPLNISGVKVAVSLLEDRKDLYKISFRSRGEIDSNMIASEFGGGGHIRAAGAVISGPYEEVIEKIVRAVYINM